MSFIDYQTFGTWVLCCIEKSIWLHYFHANDCQVRKNYLGTFFYDWSNVESRKYRHQVICDFWRDTQREVRQEVFKQLVKYAETELHKEYSYDENNSCTSLNDYAEDDERGNQVTGDFGLVSDSSSSKGSKMFLGWSVSTKENVSQAHEKLMSSSSPNKSIVNSQRADFVSMGHLDVATQSEIAYLLARANNMYEIEHFINFLSYSKIERCDMPFDKLCRQLLHIIDETQREITLKELLDEDEKTSKAKDNDQETLTEADTDFPPKSKTKSHHKRAKKLNTILEENDTESGNQSNFVSII